MTISDVTPNGTRHLHTFRAEIKVSETLIPLVDTSELSVGILLSQEQVTDR